ncbi:MAG: hypothetical protein P8P87_10635 [Crocinitomicaceae bacterium]|nr:hypothetical protein [Crocinitomicaceae bacterium]
MKFIYSILAEIAFTFAGISQESIYLKYEISSIEAGVSFVDEQRYGPYKMWHHRHVIEEVDVGVLMNDTVHFKLPFPLFSWLVYKPFVKKNLTTIFKYRTHKLDELASKNQIK